MLLDWALASLHHLAIFTLAGIIAFELALTARDVDDVAILRLARVDAWYGIVAAIVLAVGASRVIFGAKGAAYYMVNAFFCASTGGPVRRRRSAVDRSDAALSSPGGGDCGPTRALPAPTLRR